MILRQNFGCKIRCFHCMLQLYTYSVEPERDFNYFTPFNNKYVTYITLVAEVPSTPYVVYSSCYYACYGSDVISGQAKM